jgi:hypothetical protein
MKHLKRFNESKEEEFKDFKEFCKSNLAFLIDAGFTVDVSYAMYGGGFMLEVMRKGNGLFNWEEIKYDFIPFIELLQISEFSKKDIDDKSKVLFSTKTGQYEIPFESIDDTVVDLSDIKYITIHI